MNIIRKFKITLTWFDLFKTRTKNYIFKRVESSYLYILVNHPRLIPAINDYEIRYHLNGVWVKQSWQDEQKQSDVSGIRL